MLEEYKEIKEFKVGDKIEIPTSDGIITAYVAGIDCEPDVKDHHFTLVANFGDCKMGKSALHGYLGAKDMQDFLSSKTEILKRFFGDRLVRREIMVSSGIYDAPDSIYDQRDFVVSEYHLLKTYLYLMSEVELFGDRKYSLEYEMHCDKYPLFKDNDYTDLFGRVCIWLRSVWSVTFFCRASGHGIPSFGGASSSHAAVALFTIK